MKNLILIFALFFGAKSFAIETNYKLNDLSIDEKFAIAQELDLSAANLSDFKSVVVDGSKNKMTAGLLGIFCGGLGLHRFYLGQGGAGAAYLIGSLCITGGGIALTAALGFPLFAFNPIALLGLIDGIVYLVADDAEFQSKYVANKKLIQWL